MEQHILNIGRYSSIKKKVFPRYGGRDNSFERVEDLEQVENICELLVIFNEVTKLYPEVITQYQIYLFLKYKE